MRNSCFAGLEIQHTVMLCKTKGHIKAGVALFKLLEGCKTFKPAKKIGGLIPGSRCMVTSLKLVPMVGVAQLIQN